MKFDFLYCLYGRLLIFVNSPFASEFCNSCSENNIFLRNISANDRGFSCEIKAYDLIRARKLGLTRGYRIKILSRKGLILNLIPLLRRPFFFIGFILALSFVFFMSSFVWDIEINSEGLDNRLLLEELYSLGIKPGIRKQFVDNEKIKNLILLDYDELGWCVLNVFGCKAEVDYSLKRMTPELISKDDPCDVVSDSLAVIKAIDTYKGTCLVSRGDTVFPGDTIISSEVKIGNDYSEEIIYKYVHARGDVWGRTWYDLTAATPRLAHIKVYDGRIKRKVYLKNRKNRYDLSFTYGNHGGECDIIIKEYALGFGAFLCIETCEQYTLVNHVFSTEEQDRLKHELSQTLLGSMDRGHIVASVFEEQTDDECYKIRMNTECVEQIGVPLSPTTNDNRS